MHAEMPRGSPAVSRDVTRLRLAGFQRGGDHFLDLRLAQKLEHRLAERVIFRLKNPAERRIHQPQRMLPIHHHHAFLHAREDRPEVEFLAVELPAQPRLFLGQLAERMRERGEMAAVEKDKISRLPTGGECVQHFPQMPPVAAHPPLVQPPRERDDGGEDTEKPSHLRPSAMR